jgi:hypothetical protein
MATADENSLDANAADAQGLSDTANPDRVEQVTTQAATARGDDTPKTTEIQEKPTLAEQSKETLHERVARRVDALNKLQAEKEQLRLAYIYKKIPLPYHLRWKREANDLFKLQVIMRRRQQRYLSKG